jgi:hypothetical protein
VNNFALWTLQVVLALTFAMAGLAKVGGDAALEPCWRVSRAETC